MINLRGIAAFLTLLGTAAQGHAAGVTIGVVAPQGGPLGLLGAQIAAGAGFEIQQSGNTLVAVNETCEDNSGAAVADALVNAKVQIAIGFLCSETLEGALPKLKDANIPAITVSARSRILMEDALKNGWPLFRLAPADGTEAAKIIEVILKDWAADPIALIEDGTIHGRELTEAVRNALEQNGLKPVFTDTYRPGQEQQIALVRRLKRAGATRVFVGGDRNDVAVMARDAKAENIPLSILGGDAMRAADQPLPLTPGVRAVALPEYALLPEGGPAAGALRAKGTEPEGYVLPSLAAALIAGRAAEAAAAAGKPLRETLVGTTFQTPIGAVAFTGAHELSQNPYRLLEWRGNGFFPPAAPTQ
ncbi:MULTISPECIES: ABC transporter substrate-binding protein [Rhizobium]|uniref:ABC transporter substrate-binding protein n=1 Tax=Rhizobium TaxID=379 RepID=UPI0007EB3414|nr:MULTISPECIES: ABC transporter substrate-binding protein [Rhizobium]ANK85917.1 amino acid ABC transporter substrate-binding protein [Rhizobium sp. N731]ANK91826.1 amino acid ABC transporter substrate-binding protein [Rhizobium sp. N6212]ANK97860.1 amino acid ABC transporter substrate-binding protein [Rhizobium sp. N621]ANL03939.1 amino acid ABC transporter substrate-binding protein [Rhizobium esperanzae]ANL09985.1 amino acid ABC transporter substrate-binding protein [Rhizobium sp. N1341]